MLSFIGQPDMGDLSKKWKKEGMGGEWIGIKQLNNWLDDVNILIIDFKCSPRDTDSRDHVDQIQISET